MSTSATCEATDFRPHLVVLRHRRRSYTSWSAISRPTLPHRPAASPGCGHGCGARCPWPALARSRSSPTLHPRTVATATTIGSALRSVPVLGNFGSEPPVAEVRIVTVGQYDNPMNGLPCPHSPSTSKVRSVSVPSEGTMPWPQRRDARTSPGPWPQVAHAPDSSAVLLGAECAADLHGCCDESQAVSASKEHHLLAGGPTASPAEFEQADEPVLIGFDEHVVKRLGGGIFQLPRTQ